MIELPVLLYRPAKMDKYFALCVQISTGNFLDLLKKKASTFDKETDVMIMLKFRDLVVKR